MSSKRGSTVHTASCIVHGNSETLLACKDAREIQQCMVDGNIRIT